MPQSTACERTPDACVPQVTLHSRLDQLYKIETAQRDTPPQPPAEVEQGEPVSNADAPSQDGEDDDLDVHEQSAPVQTSQVDVEGRGRGSSGRRGIKIAVIQDSDMDLESCSQGASLVK